MFRFFGVNLMFGEGVFFTGGCFFFFFARVLERANLGMGVAGMIV